MFNSYNRIIENSKRMHTVNKLLLKLEGIYNEMFVVVISGEWNHNGFSFPTFYVGNICHFYNIGTLLETGNKNYNVE